MKKTIFLFFVLITFFIAGCNEKDLIKQIDGSWHVQNYSVNGVDQTHWFDTTYAGFVWTFSGNVNFNQSWQVIKPIGIYNLDTIVSYDTTTHAFVIDSITTSIATVPTVITNYVNGQWYLTNGNHFIETQDSTFGTRLYQIISHSKGNLHLLYNNEDYYLSK